MKKILFTIPIIIFLCFSCNSNRISKLENRNKELEDSLNLFKNKYVIRDSLNIYIDKYIEKDSLYDSIYQEYRNLREKVTLHKKYYFTVYDTIIIDEDGYEWDFYDFLNEYSWDYIKDCYSKWEIIEYLGISKSDFDDY